MVYIRIIFYFFYFMKHEYKEIENFSSIDQWTEIIMR